MAEACRQLRKIRWSFRLKFSAQFFALILLTIGGLSSFFLVVFSRDKLASTYEQELSNAVQAAQYLENALLFARQATPEQIVDSPAIAFLLESPCQGGGAEAVSRLYAAGLERLGLPPRAWLRAPELGRACASLRGPGEVVILQEKSPDFRLPSPAVVALVGTAGNASRLVMIPMESFTDAHAEVRLGLTTAQGQTLWGEEQSLEAALTGVGAKVTDLGVLTQQSVQQMAPTVAPIGAGGIAAIAPVLARWALVSFATEAAVLRPVRFFVTQSLWLATGFFFLCLLAGKLIADRVSRPLQSLSILAEEFGHGNLTARAEVNQNDEFGLLQGTFNSMAEQIEKLLAETRARALLEADVQLAQKVQEMLFPGRRVELGDHEISSHVCMANKCGGDWWGYIDVPREIGQPYLLLLIGDVTGHGVSSALVTAAASGGASVLSNWVRAQPELAKDPRFLLKLFNRAIFDSARGELNMTFFSAVIDPNEGMLHAANAGHGFPYVIAPSEEGPTQVTVTSVGRPGQALGQDPERDFTELVSVPWKPGYQLFLYTDGLIEAYAEDKNLFDRRSLIRALRESGGAKGSALLKKVLDARAAAVGKLTPEDDITALVCVHKGGGRS